MIFHKNGLTFFLSLRKINIEIENLKMEQSLLYILVRDLSKYGLNKGKNFENFSSAEYDALLAAEANAEKEKKGLFAERTDAKTGEKKGTQRITVFFCIF